MTYNYNLSNILNWRQEFNNEVLDKTFHYQRKYGFKLGEGDEKTHNNEADAFKHAFMQALLVYKGGGSSIPATILGNFHEFEGDISHQPFEEKNMDLWNNEIGRKIAQETIQQLQQKNLGQINAKEFEDIVAQKIYYKMKNGELITNPYKDKRIYSSKQNYSTGYASPIQEQLYTVEDIKNMPQKEFRQNWDKIMKQMKTVGVPYEKELKQKHYTTPKNSHWVTINGNHVLIED